MPLHIFNLNLEKYLPATIPHIKISWPHGGMGNAMHTLLCVCADEVRASVDFQLLPTDGGDWHTVSSSIESNIIEKHHPDIHPDAITIGSSNFYFMQLMSWAKWSGYPIISTAEELELLHLSLNNLTGNGFPRLDFDVIKLFERDAVQHVTNFIIKLGLTPNNYIADMISYIVKNNQPYYNKILSLQQIVQDVVDKKDTDILELSLPEQALLMSLVYNRTLIPFKLVYCAFNNTTDIWNSMENNNG